VGNKNKRESSHGRKKKGKERCERKIPNKEERSIRAKTTNGQKKKGALMYIWGRRKEEKKGGNLGDHGNVQRNFNQMSEKRLAKQKTNVSNSKKNDKRRGREGEVEKKRKPSIPFLQGAEKNADARKTE